ncbi:MAG: serine hydrolase, partial [Pseudomonadota bacterium]
MARSYRNADPPLPIMQGVPVPEAWRVPAHDWDNPPWNRWSFQHMRQICPTIDVAAGAEIWAMPAQPADVDGIAYTDLDGNASTWAQMLELTYTDAALIWLDGRIIAESYFNGMTPRTQHLAFSVSKSVVSAAAGVLIGEGLMDPAASVTDLMPELDATGWTGASLQHVLDMASGVVFDETYGNQDAHVFLLDVAAGVKPLYPWMDPETVPRTTLDLILS